MSGGDSSGRQEAGVLQGQLRQLQGAGGSEGQAAAEGLGKAGKEAARAESQRQPSLFYIVINCGIKGIVMSACPNTGITQKNAEKVQLKSKSREPGARSKKQEAASMSMGPFVRFLLSLTVCVGEVSVCLSVCLSRGRGERGVAGAADQETQRIHCSVLLPRGGPSVPTHNRGNITMIY